MGRRRVLVYGLGVSGRAVTSRLQAEGIEVVVADDDPGDRPRRTAAEAGVRLLQCPDERTLVTVAGEVDEVVVSPGVPAAHRVFSLAGRVPVIGEVELAWRRAEMPVVAVTGTNGKTTVVTLAARMLVASGRRALAAGNIGLPLLEAVHSDAEVVVAEVSSFQLALTTTFRPRVSAWVNFAPDHLDWHPDLDHYRAAKARLWANIGPGDLAVANAEDQVVLDESTKARRRGAGVLTFGLSTGDYTVRDGALVGPEGPIVDVDAMARPYPHEIADALCASALALAAGGELEACRRALEQFEGLPHRLQLVGEANGVRFYDDSKATTPAAVLADMESFPSAVLVAGGRNKGLDLTPLRTLAPHLKAVVAIGEASDELVDVFGGACPVQAASSMEQAVQTAMALAGPGDAVVLSPACSSFDWYASYAQRGDDFARLVRALPASPPRGR
jgi:UDP-N-acetylmuramoylalanine--D-glutamate ligase